MRQPVPLFSPPAGGRGRGWALSNARSAHEVQHKSEKALGDKATAQETDKYGRTLRTITRGGESLGAVLVAEGLAEEGKACRSGWC